MPWAVFEENGKYCIHKLDADDNKTGASLGCHPSRAEAQRQVAALYAGEKTKEFVDSLKAGARHSYTDRELVQKAHDALCELGAKCKEPERALGEFDSVDKLAIFKDATGRYRWVLFSSSAFEDRDGEVVSTKALEADAERMTETGKYGPLRWWHIGKPNLATKEAGPGLDIGDCDFSAMHGKMSIESGTFRDEYFGERLALVQDDLGVSRGFFHPLDEPDKEDVFWNIHTFERSLLPTKEKASNLLSRFFAFNHKESMDMADMTLDRIKAFIEKLGGGPAAAQKVESVLSTAGQDEKAALEAGIRTKEEEKPEDEDKKPAGITAAEVKEMINKAFTEYDERKSGKEKETAEASTKATSELTVTLKAIQDGQAAATKAQAELTDAVKLALEGVAELKGELPRKLGDPRQFYRPSQDGAQPGPQFQPQMQSLAESLKQIGGDSGPFSKFEQAIFGGNQPTQFVAPDAPKGN